MQARAKALKVSPIGLDMLLCKRKEYQYLSQPQGPVAENLCREADRLSRCSSLFQSLLCSLNNPLFLTAFSLAPLHEPSLDK